MLPQKFRIKYQDFQKNKTPKKKYEGNIFSIEIKKSLQKQARFCIVAPKKIDKRASKRNRARRIVAEYLYKNINRANEYIQVLIKIKKPYFKHTDIIELKNGKFFKT